MAASGIMKTVKRIWNTVTTILVTVVVILALLLVGAPVIGLQTYVVLSGSMEPTIQTGSLLYVKETDPKQLQVGDVITFLFGEDAAATHRVVEVVPDEDDPSLLRYRTKGDANELEDGKLVQPHEILGTPVASIPYVGFLASYIQSPPGSYVAIGCGAVLLLLVLLPEIFGSNEKNKKQ